jgi:hypothetical protein
MIKHIRANKIFDFVELKELKMTRNETFTIYEHLEDLRGRENEI